MNPPAPEFDAIQNSPQRLGVLLKLIAVLAREGWQSAKVLEVGSYEGSSALVLSDEVASCFPQGGSILCVDPWEVYLPEEQFNASAIGRRMLDALRTGQVFARFQSNIKFAASVAPIRYHRARFADIAWRLQDEGPFDIIYIDGDHRYAAVREDIAAARTLLAPGGLLCGDDLEVQFTPVVAEEIRLDLDYMHGYHPGVTLAVWEAFGGHVWCEAAVWAVRKGYGGEWRTEEVGV